MKEYIERDLLVEEFDRLIGIAKICKDIDAKPDPEKILIALRDDVKTCPAADVCENVRATWLINPDGYYPYCSRCKQEPQGHVMTDFCPN